MLILCLPVVILKDLDLLIQNAKLISSLLQTGLQVGYFDFSLVKFFLFRSYELEHLIVLIQSQEPLANALGCRTSLLDPLRVKHSSVRDILCSDAINHVIWDIIFVEIYEGLQELLIGEKFLAGFPIVWDFLCLTDDIHDRWDLAKHTNCLHYHLHRFGWLYHNLDVVYVTLVERVKGILCLFQLGFCDGQLTLAILGDDLCVFHTIPDHLLFNFNFLLLWFHCKSLLLNDISNLLSFS